MNYILFCFSPFGPFQSTLLFFGLLGHFGVLSAAVIAGGRLGHFGLLWSFGTVWVTLVVWAILGYFCRLGHFFWLFEPVCVALVVWASFGFLVVWATLGYFGHFWATLGLIGPLLSTWHSTWSRPWYLLCGKLKRKQKEYNQAWMNWQRIYRLWEEFFAFLRPTIDDPNKCGWASRL